MAIIDGLDGGSLKMERKFSNSLKELFDDPFNSPLLAWLPGAGGLVGLALGVLTGFHRAGIGGAIGYGIGGAVAGAAMGLIAALGIAFFVEAIPWLVIAAIIGALIWVIRALWGAGNP